MHSSPAFIVNNLYLCISQLMGCQSSRNRCPGRVNMPCRQLEYIDIAVLSGATFRRGPPWSKAVMGHALLSAGHDRTHRTPGQPTRRRLFSQYKTLSHNLRVHVDASSSEPISATNPPARLNGIRDSDFTSQRPNAMPEPSRSDVAISTPSKYHAEPAIIGNPAAWA